MLQAANFFETAISAGINAGAIVAEIGFYELLKVVDVDKVS